MSLNNPFPVLPVQVNNYVLEKLIGKGGFGYVYLANSTLYQCQFAVKVGMMPENNKKKCDKIKESFESEFNALKKLDHPNIIRLYDYFNQDGLIFLVLEYCPNGSLEDYINGTLELQKQNITASPYSPTSKASSLNNNKCGLTIGLFSSVTDKFKVIIDIMKGLQYCHQNNIAHRDIKTANILFDENGRVKIADFGLARLVSNEELMITHEGTAYYAAPELFKKQKYDAYKADIWALGVLLYRFFTFDYPFKGNNMESLYNEIRSASPDFQAIIRIPGIKSILQKIFRLHPPTRISIDEAINEVENGLNQFSITKNNSLPEKITLKMKKSILMPISRRASNNSNSPNSQIYKSFGYQNHGFRINRSMSRGFPLTNWQTF